jgi:hypothetical protein
MRTILSQLCRTSPEKAPARTRPRAVSGPKGCPLGGLVEVVNPGSFGAVNEVEDDLIPLLQRVEVDQGDLGPVEERLIAVFGADKAEATFRDDLLDATSGHLSVLQEGR